MADNSVFISGISDSAFNDLPPWATDDTAQEIAAYLKKMYDLQADTLVKLVKKASSNSSGADSGTMKEANDELDKYAKNIKKANDEQPKDRKYWKDTDNQRDKDRKYWKDGLGYRAKNLIIAEGFVKLGEKLIDVYGSYIDISDSLFKSGVNVLNGNNSTASSLDSLNQIVVLSGLRLETLQKVIEKYSSSINAVGVNKFAKTISMTNTRLIAMGYSSEQQAELIGTLIESESAYTDIRNKSSKELADNAVSLGTQLTKLSLLTGQSSEKLQENLKSLSKNTDSTVVSALYGEKAAERMNLFSASFKDADIGQMFQKLAASSAPQVTKAFQSLAQAGSGGLAQQFTEIAQAARDGRITTEEAVRRSTTLAAQVGPQTMRTLSILADSGMEGAQETLNVITKLREQSNTTSKMTKEQRDNAIKSQAAVSALRTQQEKFSAALQRLFTPTIGMLTLLTNGLTYLNDAVDSVKSAFEWLDEKALNPLNAVLGVFGMHVDKINSLDWIGFIAASIAMIKGVQLIGRALSIFKIGSFNKQKGFGYNQSSGYGPNNRGGNSGPGMLEKLGKGIGEIGKGLGTGIGGLLKGFLTGLAEGMTALGNPKVLLGALSLAGISGAIFVGCDRSRPLR